MADKLAGSMGFVVNLPATFYVLQSVAGSEFIVEWKLLPTPLVQGVFP